ncbi:unnamed protein product [Amoebophrya sp. A25]|nr:unnamed protein product [Amoebophrya sp. A25]|eukprot:GSA25T00003943001.1
MCIVIETVANKPEDLQPSNNNNENTSCHSKTRLVLGAVITSNELMIDICPPGPSFSHYKRTPRKRYFANLGRILSSSLTMQLMLVFTPDIIDQIFFVFVHARSKFHLY